MAYELLDLIETYAVQDAARDRIFAREGFSISSPHRRKDDPRYLQRVRVAGRLWADVCTGRQPMTRFQEAMSTSDFPLLFGDVIDRQTIAAYREWPTTYRTIAHISTVPDFREVRRSYSLLGGDDRLTEVHELEEYKGSALTETDPITFRVKKFGRILPFSWEARINDDTGQLSDIPTRFARGARRSEQYFATSLYVASTGPHASVYTAGNKNQVIVANGSSIANPHLSIQGLQDAFTVLGNQVDPVSGEAIYIEAAVLEVPPALRVIAQNIINATQIIIGKDSDDQRILTANWMRDNVTLVVNPTLRMINTTNGNTAWYLHAAANQGRPLIEVAFLRGNEEPAIFMKAPDAIRVGGGNTVDPMAGDFMTDSIAYKIRAVSGGSVIDPLASVASKGTDVA